VKILADNLVQALDIAIKTQHAKEVQERGPRFKSIQVSGWEDIRNAVLHGEHVEVGYPLTSVLGGTAPKPTSARPLPTPMPSLQQVKSAMDWWNSFSPMIQQRYVAEHGARPFSSAIDIARFWVSQFPKTAAGTDFT
jgi:hypothetical protein